MRAWLVLLAACAVHHRSDERIVAPETLEAEFRAATCAHLAACHVYVDAATCLATNLDMSPLDEPAFAAVNAGRMSFDAAKAEQCIDALANASCLVGQPGQQDPFARCWSGVFGCSTPPLALGAACTSGMCVAGAYCSPETHQCASTEPQGASCTNDPECGALRCIDHTCSSLPSLGESCQATAECGELGTHCDDADTGLCVADAALGNPGPHLGEPCEGACSDYNTRCSEQKICAAYLATGEACTQFYECWSDFCGPDGRCASQPNDVCPS